jgi:uncharacterized protein (DUF488 family)
MMTARHATIFTVGHSTRSAREFGELLGAHGVRAIADVRRFPMSRRYPHFNVEAMAKWLGDFGIEYLPFLELGGRRRARADSINTGWRNESFRGYADFMATPEFRAGLVRLEEVARVKATAIMCAEAVPWRCHRTLISDALVARGWRVLEILSAAEPKAHEMTKFARVMGPEVTYPGEETLFDDA